jgi:C-terminal processing protease CtpA/Prc
MNFVANTEALIIDLRNCLGGYPDMVSLICSYLFSEKPVHLNSIYWKDEGKTQEFWTLRNISGDRFIGNPVYILTSKDTISAGEEFAFDLRMLDRATLVGERTNGSAHPGASYRLHPNFEVFIPIGYAINPISKDNWEGVGVEPDVSVPQEQGLTVSYKLALESIIQTLTLPSSYQNECQLVETEAALDKINSANKSPGNNPV